MVLAYRYAFLVILDRCSGPAAARRGISKSAVRQCDHLSIVGGGLQRILEQLSTGQIPLRRPSHPQEQRGKRQRPCVAVPLREPPGFRARGFGCRRIALVHGLIGEDLERRGPAGRRLRVDCQSPIEQTSPLTE